jgi:hypothetical protein
LLFPIRDINEDSRIHPKTIVFVVEINGTFKAYRQDDLQESKSIEDSINGVKMRIERDEDGTIQVTNLYIGE